MDKAAKLGEQVIFAIGNAPTALVRLYELIKRGKDRPGTCDRGSGRICQCCTVKRIDLKS